MDRVATEVFRADYISVSNAVDDASADGQVAFDAADRRHTKDAGGNTYANIHRGHHRLSGKPPRIAQGAQGAGSPQQILIESLMILLVSSER